MKCILLLKIKHGTYGKFDQLQDYNLQVGASNKT